MSSTEKIENQALLINALEAFLSSRIGVVEVSRWVCHARFALRQGSNPLFTPFVGIASETDNFPVGPVRELWSPDALVRYDQERALLEQHFSSQAMRLATELLSWARSQEF